MPWIDNTNSIPLNSKYFMSIINGLVFECPSSHRKGKSENIYYERVAHKGTSFRDRRIEDSLLTKLNKIITASFRLSETYYPPHKSNKDNLEETYNIMNASKDNDNYEFIIFGSSGDMTDTEAIYYYIRNAFAHGEFEVIQTRKNKIYKLENNHNGILKARMRLKETTLLSFVKFAKISKDKLESIDLKHI